MTHRKGTFKPASARSKKAALAASEDEPGQLDQEDSDSPVRPSWGDSRYWYIGCDDA